MSSKSNNDTWYQWKHGAIKKLDGTNYDDWRRSIRSALGVIRAFNIVTGEEQEPPAGNTAAARAALDNYQERRALAAHLLTYTCMPNVQIHVRDLEDPSEIWQTLLRRLDFTASQTGRAAILTKFLNARPASGEKIGAYIARLQGYQTQLFGTAEAISDGLLKSQHPPVPRNRVLHYDYAKKPCCTSIFCNFFSCPIATIFDSSYPPRRPATRTSPPRHSPHR